MLRLGATAAIQSRTKGADKKTSEEPPSDIQSTAERLWEVGSPISLADYTSPWDSIGKEIWARLLTSLESVTPAEAATVEKSIAEIDATAPHLGYAACVKTFIRKAPSIHRILTDIRGLALAVDPKLLTSRKKAAPKNVLPGEPLIYDTM